MRHKRYQLTTCICSLYVFALLQATAATIPPTADLSTNTASQVVDTGKVLIEYSQFIRDETARHQAFLEGLYDKLVKVLGAIVIVFGTVLTWLNWKTKKDIDVQVNKRIDSMAKVAIDPRSHLTNS